MLSRAVTLLKDDRRLSVPKDYGSQAAAAVRCFQNALVFDPSGAALAPLKFHDGQSTLALNKRVPCWLRNGCTQHLHAFGTMHVSCTDMSISAIHPADIPTHSAAI